MISQKQTIAAVWFVVSLVLMLTGSASEAYAQKRGTTVGQVNGTPSGAPNTTVRLEAGLSVAPSVSWGYWQCLSGPVKLYYASGSNWVYVAQANASGCYGLPNSYGKAVFNFRIPSSARRNAYLRVRYEYPGNSWYYSSVGYGNVYVR